MITIKKPTVKVVDGMSVLECSIFVDDNEKVLFYEVEEKYGKYLCTDRCDAFVLASLYFAMKNNHNIVSKLPITSSLHHNLTTYLIPTLSKHSKALCNIKIDAPLIYEPVETLGYVGTGMSCGIDSFHTINNYYDPKYDDMKITHLCLNNVGSFNTYSKRYNSIGTDVARDGLIERASKVADELGLPLIVSNSNVHKIFVNNYYRVHTFANMFSVLLMQKFFGTYYYSSSGYDLSHYNVVDSKKLDSAEYELLTFYCLQSSTLKIHSEGAAKSRLEKTISIADYEMANKYLHVCIKDSFNCGKCMKCKRTLVSLDAIGKLDNFSEVFDIDYYKKNRDWYYKWLKKEYNSGSEMNSLSYKLLSQKHGKTEYNNIEKFNDNNIIIPDIKYDTFSITDKDGNYVFNKNENFKYKSNLYNRLLLALYLCDVKKDKFLVPEYYRDNFVYRLKKKKFKYLLSLPKRKKMKVSVSDLICMLLYRPFSYKGIYKNLKHLGVLPDEFYHEMKGRYSALDLISLYNKLIAKDLFRNVINSDEYVINDYSVKTINSLNKDGGNFYRNSNYKNIYLPIKRSSFVFVGQIRDYSVLIISNYDGKKEFIYKGIQEANSLIKQLDDKISK
ncbi:MAG: hypothetical protein Q4C29_00815 [bacterium]|nr:hypothetical protein [bacterium]